jgi:acetoin utilization protein AcuB
MTAEEIMTENVATVEETQSIAEALEILSELTVRHLPVVRGSEVTGMLSDRDIRSLVGLQLGADQESLDKVRTQINAPVSSVMRSDVVSVDRSADLVEVIDLMLDEKVGAVPVVDEETNDLVGIVSYIDVLRTARDSVAE